MASRVDALDAATAVVQWLGGVILAMALIFAVVGYVLWRQDR